MRFIVLLWWTTTLKCHCNKNPPKTPQQNWISSVEKCLVCPSWLGSSRKQKTKQAKQQMNKMINGLICMGLVLSEEVCPSAKNVADLQSRGVDAPHEIIVISAAWLLLITWSPRGTLALCAMQILSERIRTNCCDVLQNATHCYVLWSSCLSPRQWQNSEKQNKFVLWICK